MWFISDPLLNSLVTGNCSDRSFAEMAFRCACLTSSSDSSSPCSCLLGNNNKLTLSCPGKRLSDASISTVLDQASATLPIDTVDFSRNALTKVPTKLVSFSTLENVNLASNKITYIARGDLPLRAKIIKLDLTYNKITSIQDYAFSGT